MQPLSGNQRPDLLTALMNMSLVLRLPRKMHLCRSSSNAPRLPSFLEMPQNSHVLLTFDKVHNPLRLPRKTTLPRPKAARTCGALYILTSKCASRHNGVHFLNISKLPKVPRTRWFSTLLTRECASRHNDVHFFRHLSFQKWSEHVVFLHIDLEMCFASQRRALSRHLNYQNGSEPEVFCAFEFEMCFAPQRRAIFHLSSGQLARQPPL